MDGPFWGLLGQWGPSGAIVALLAAFVWAILTGRLIPRKVHEDIRQDLKDRTAQIGEERDAWRTAHETSEGTRRIMAEQVEKLLAQATVTNELLASLKAEARKS